MHVDAGGVAAPTNWPTLRSPETYVGASRGTGPSARAPDELVLNQRTLTGAWTIDEKFAEPGGDGASIAFASRRATSTSC